MRYFQEVVDCVTTLYTTFAATHDRFRGGSGEGDS